MNAQARPAELPAPQRLGASVRRILPLAWPVVVGQVALLGFSTVDTILMARQSATELAALAIGSAVYVTVFVGLMGLIMAIGPIVGRLYGARELTECGRQFWQAVWLAALAAVLGAAALSLPEPFLALSQVGPEVADKVRGYLLALAFALPASLAFTVFRGFNNAVSRPKAVMAFQVAGLMAKVPLSMLLSGGSDALGLQARGVVGCGIATAIAMWAQLLVASLWLSRDPFYRQFALNAPGQRRLDLTAVRALLKLGIPMGLSIAVEVTGFVFMALFIARLGAQSVAGHQIVTNLVALMFMVPLGLSSATTTLVAQRIGANDLNDAHRLGWHGLQFATLVALGLAVLVLLTRSGIVGLYTDDALVAAAALPLLAWAVVFHVVDALQTVAAFVLRAWHVATMPMAIYVVALWGVGLGGGQYLAYGDGPLSGARGFWVASTTGLSLAAVAMTALLWFVVRRRLAEAGAPAPLDPPHTPDAVNSGGGQRLNAPAD